MVAKDLISDVIPPLKTSDSGSKALNWMNEFHVTHLPIVNEKQFLGLVSEEDILDLNDPDQPLGNHELSLFRPYIYEHQHIFEVIKLTAELKLSLVPVIDKDENFVGIISLENLVGYLAKVSAIKDPGGIIVLELNIKDYSLSEIARIVESNDTRIISLYLNTKPDSTKIEITLKINATDLKHIIATFERFDYHIKASYRETEHLDDLMENYEGLMRYLNI